MKTLIFFATYNEAGNVKTLIEGIRENAPGADIVVVDDNSPDGTEGVIRDLKFDNVSVLVRKAKLGLGTAHLLAFCYAIANGYQALVTMDADGSHDPIHLTELLAQLPAGRDFAIGSRYMKGGACDYTGYRLRVSQAANIAARVLLSIKLSEFTTSYRAFRVERLCSLNFEALLVGGYSFFLKTVVEAARRNWSLGEVPIHFHERGYGTSKIPSFEVFRGMLNLARLAAVKLIARKPRSAVFVPAQCHICETCFSAIKTASGVFCVFCGATTIA